MQTLSMIVGRWSKGYRGRKKARAVGAVAARSTIALDDAAVTRGVAIRQPVTLVFENGDAGLPIVLGGPTYETYARGTNRIKGAQVKINYLKMGTLRRFAFVALCGLLACRRDPAPAAPELPTVDDMRNIEQETHLKFPETCRVLFWKAGGRMDANLKLKVEMPAADWPTFIATSPFRDQPLQEGARGVLGADDGAWAPSRIAHLPKGQVQLPDARYLNLGADLSRPDVVVVYVFWFET